MATIELSLAEYDALRARATHAELELAKSRDERRLPTSEREADLLASTRHALAVVRFAVSNLDPETIRNWPWRDLEAFADHFGVTGTPEVHEQEALDTFRIFARECEDLDRLRADNRHKERERQPRG